MPACFALERVASERPVRSVRTVRPAVVSRFATAAPIAPAAITATIGGDMTGGSERTYRGVQVV